MEYKSKYTPKKKRKQYNVGGYGYSDYGSNTHEAQLEASRINELQNAATSDYNQNQETLITDYKNNIQTSNQQIQENMKLESQVKGGINTLLSYKPDPKGNSYRQNINEWTTDNIGLGQSGTVSPDYPRDLSGGYDAATTTTGDPGGIGQYATDQGLADADLRYYQDQYNKLDTKLNTDAPVSDADSTEVANAATSVASKPTGTISGTSASYNPEFYEVVGDEVIDKATNEVVEEVATDVATDVGGKAAGTVASAPVKGGLWTAAVDMGLDYLSDDQDASTYTAGEVGTDVASLALDVVTFDWIGAGMQLWDIGSQWHTRNKLQKKDRKRKSDLAKKQTKLENQHTADLLAASESKGSQKSRYGKRAVYGSGEVGGFKYNI